MSTNTKYLLVVVGPTAIGKTKVSIEIANAFNAEIISADSRQFYKEMSIGTAKPSPSELDQAPHHFVDFLSIEDEYSAGKFETESLRKIEELHKVSDMVVVAGGSGLYVDAICYGLDDLPSNPVIREELNERYRSEGLEPLQKELLKLDPVHYEKMDINNPQRLIRALEVCLDSGLTYSSLRKNSKADRPFQIIKIGLKAERDIIYDRINKRVDQMVAAGLVNEVESLLSFKNLNALNTVGYKELIAYFNGEIDSLDEAIELIKMNTRRFAKRQMTWFKKDQSIIWFEYTELDKILDFVRDYISRPSI